MRIACVGGGQLARMIGEAGQSIDVTLRSAGVVGSCAFHSCESYIESLESDASLKEFLDDVDVFTFESEHEGLDVADRVSALGIPVRPHVEFVRIAGDRLLEKTMLQKCSLPVAEFYEINPTDNHDELTQFLQETFEASSHGIVIKTRRGGYDGKGQWVLNLNTKEEDFASCAHEISELIDTPGCIVEHLIDFSIECSILATRSTSGEIATWPLTHNIHEDSILRRSSAPITHISNIDELEAQALNMVTTLCNENDYVGTIAIECFVTPDGLIINEIAPRVHNSGHWTIEGAATSQFEQHARAVVGMDLGETTLVGHAIMINIVGRDIDHDALKGIDNVFVHWYDKEVRPKRKVGHITLIASNESECLALEKKVRQILDDPTS